MQEVCQVRGELDSVVLGMNVWSGAGNVASDVHYGVTGQQKSACNFKLCIEEPQRPMVYVRVNLYGENVDVCQRRALMKGDYVVVCGELMNRQGRADDTLLEVRCTQLVIIQRKVAEQEKLWQKQERL